MNRLDDHDWMGGGVGDDNSAASSGNGNNHGSDNKDTNDKADEELNDVISMKTVTGMRSLSQMLKAVLMDQTAVTYGVKHGRRKWWLVSFFSSGKRLIISGRNDWLSCGIATSKTARNEGETAN
jgi:hypothetical protein